MVPLFVVPLWRSELELGNIFEQVDRRLKAGESSRVLLFEDAEEASENAVPFGGGPFSEVWELGIGSEGT